MNLHTGLTLTLLVGLPLMLLAIGVLAHAYLLAVAPTSTPPTWRWRRWSRTPARTWSPS